MTFFLRLFSAQPARQLCPWLLLFCVSLPWLAQAQSPSGNVTTLSTQAQVDAFPASCTSLSGSLIVSGESITNLDALKNLRVVVGDLQIENNPKLTSIAGLASLELVYFSLRVNNDALLSTLDGLNRLVSVGSDFRDENNVIKGTNGDIQIQNNPKLTSIAALTALTTVARSVIITNDTLLPTLNGLNKLWFVGSDLQIQNNPQLTSITALTSLTLVNNSVIISDNALLPSLDGLNKLQVVGIDLRLENNPRLTSVAALTALTRVDNNVQITNDAQLTSLGGLNKLQTVNGDLIIENNPQLTSIAALAALTSAGNSVQISNNAQLTSLDGLNKLQSVGGTLQLLSNPRLTSISALMALTHVGNSVQIINDALLTTLDGLNKLQSLGGDLSLQSNPKLTNIAALTSLTSIGSKVQISNNAQLATLSGLNKLQSVGGTLQIQDNPQLTSIAALSALTSVNNYVQISNNAQLTSLDGLNKLQSVGTVLAIEDNPQLTSLQGLNSLTSIGNYFQIQNNIRLSQCAIASICALLNTAAATDYSTIISGNAPGCNSIEQVQDRCIPLGITTQPPGQSAVCAGSRVTAAVSTTGNARTYQWYKGNQPVAGQTTDALSLTNVQLGDVGTYRVVVSNSVSSLTSTAFSLTLTPSSPDYQPLVDLYNATNGASWTRNDNWLSGCSPCGWAGVTCTNGRVTGLNLISNNLAGTLPASLSALSALTSLELGANALTGGIPTGIGRLTNLQTINLSRTQLGGTIPASLGQLTRLQNLLLNESALTGPLPAGLGSLSQLQNLQLYTNQLSGCFPASYTSLCGKQVSFATNPGLPGGGDFAAFCTDGSGGQLAISQYPQSGTACVGSAFSFSVVARGAGSYQWYKDGQRLAETGPVLRLASVSASDAGTYQVYINYACGTGAVQSDYVTLTVPQPGTGGCPQVNTAPVATANASQTAITGQSFSYTVNAFTDEQTPTSLTYSASISPANGLTFNPTTRVVSGIPTTTGASTVTLTATDPGGLSTSTSFNVTVTAPPAPVLTTQPAAGSSVCAGASVRISVAATGSGNLTYQWYKDGSLLGGQTAATLTLDNVTATQGGSYQAVVSNGFNSTTSTAFSLTVNPTPVVSISPSSTVICAGQVATLAASSGASYRWNTGQTSQSISVSATGTYAVTATTASGCSASATTPVTVTPRPASPYATSVPRRLYTTNFPIPLILYALPTGFNLNLSFYNGATNAQISPAFVQPNKAGVFAYYATQTDSKGCVSLPTPVSLTVLEGGTLATKPADRTVCSGASTVLSVTATGSNPRYTWYEATPDRPYNVVEAGSNTKGGNTASLTVSKLPRTTLYYCLVIGQNGLDVAGPIKVTLNTNCQGRLGVEEPAAPLSVVVLGNPVQGGELSVEIRGAEGQPLQLRLTDSQGRAVGEQQLPRAEAVERRHFEVGSQPAGLLLLQVSTPTQRQSVKVLKVD